MARFIVAAGTRLEVITSGGHRKLADCESKAIAEHLAHLLNEEDLRDVDVMDDAADREARREEWEPGYKQDAA